MSSEPLVEKNQETTETPSYVTMPKILHCLSSTVLISIAVYEIVSMVQEKTPYMATAVWCSIIWVVFMGLAGIFGVIGSYTENRFMIVASTVLQVAILTPITPQLVFYSKGVDTWYFISVTVFCFFSGITGVALYVNLETEEKAQEARRALKS